ncbi:exodeoxyribonuclease VII large subunit [Pelagibacterium lacus]|uniref:Exodeoxyribonuclease 7 large subunit n=1 Tax=Pelagibacterium lacus TaxID=2282655 RepID=A0A369W8H3_9HYPH|nr:exodeoxyribonuclease VII large subunit [Pelagibacterium lacus]RDE10643.1 exodeoxyribonuclease VII large subunit [Pelagibacterium lacus]
MSDAQSNAHEFTVTEISSAVKRTVEDTFGFVRVRGEISGFRGRHSSGHSYFTLKDDGAVIDAVVWKGSYQRLTFKPEEGLEVIATGRLTTYPRSSKYQIVIEQIEPAGAGALMALLEERRKKLLAEGLFAPERKRPLPYLPQVIGVITSPTGAVIRDILHRLDDRFPSHVIVWPVRVQGETCAPEVTAAIDGFNALSPDGPIPRPDLLIVARGGGSIEDLWGFNEESVVRAVARSAIPVISAVGHETDITLIDYVADKRAPTPTGAAEMAVPVRAELIAYVEDLGTRQRQATRRAASSLRDRLRAASAGLPRPGDLVSTPRQRLDMATTRLGSALRVAQHNKALDYQRVSGRLAPGLLRQRAESARNRLDTAATRAAYGLQTRLGRARLAYTPLAGRLRSGLLAAPVDRGARRLETAAARLDAAYLRTVETRRARLDGLSKLLSSVSYHQVLARGFALVTDSAGNLVRTAADVQPGDALSIDVAQGTIAATVAGAPPIPRRKSRADQGPDEQESLF